MRDEKFLIISLTILAVVIVVAGVVVAVTLTPSKEQKEQAFNDTAHAQAVDFYSRVCDIDTALRDTQREWIIADATADDAAADTPARVEALHRARAEAARLTESLGGLNAAEPDGIHPPGDDTTGSVDLDPAARAAADYANFAQRAADDSRWDSDDAARRAHVAAEARVGMSSAWLNAITTLRETLQDNPPQSRATRKAVSDTDACRELSDTSQAHEDGEAAAELHAISAEHTAALVTALARARMATDVPDNAAAEATGLIHRAADETLAAADRAADAVDSAPTMRRDSAKKSRDTFAATVQSAHGWAEKLHARADGPTPDVLDKIANESVDLEHDILAADASVRTTVVPTVNEKKAVHAGGASEVSVSSVALYGVALDATTAVGDASGQVAGLADTVRGKSVRSAASDTVAALDELAAVADNARAGLDGWSSTEPRGVAWSQPVADTGQRAQRDGSAALSGVSQWASAMRAEAVSAAESGDAERVAGVVRRISDEVGGVAGGVSSWFVSTLSELVVPTVDTAREVQHVRSSRSE